MLKIQYYILSLLLLLCSFGFSQEDKSALLDSLKKRLKKAEEFQFDYKIKESFEEANRAIDFAAKLKDYRYLAHIYNTIGINYETILDFENAEKSYKKGLANAQKVKNDTLIGWFYNNLGNVYTDGYKKADKGIEFYKRSLEIASARQDSVDMLTPILNIGWTYVDEKKWDFALPYLTRAKSFIDKKGNAQAIMQVNYLFGVYHSNKGNNQQAVEYFDTAIQIGKNGTYPSDMAEIYLAISNHYARLGNSKAAYDALTKHNEYKDILFNEDKVRQIELAKARFDADEYRRDLEIAKKEKEAQEKIVRQSKQATMLAGLAFLVSFVLLVLLYNIYKAKNRVNTLLKYRNEQLFKATEEAKRLSQMKSQFIASVSHELRTPLYGVVGLTQLLMEEENLSKKEHQYLKSLKFSGDYLLNLINDVLQLSKIEANKVTIANTTFNLKALTKDIVNSFDFQAEIKGNNLLFYFDDAIPTMVKGDSIRLSQILINLIGNAIKFTKEGNVWFSMKMQKRTETDVWVEFIVEDDGPGIPKEKQQEVFENFSQLGRDENVYQGTGLGLSIVKKLVSLLGGDIALQSAKGRGSKFSFVLTFPIDFEAVTEEDVEITPHLLNGKNRVLVVEDNKINQIVTQNILQKENFECVIVDNGLEAVEMMKKQDFDLVLMDLNMPMMSGTEASKKIREFNAVTPIIALTALQIDEIKEDLFKSGINDIINKPYDKLEFYQTILKNLNKAEVIKQAPF